MTPLNFYASALLYIAVQKTFSVKSEDPDYRPMLF